MTSFEFVTPFEDKSTKRLVSYGVGQPMGLLSS
jgi:hypothetical protein